MNLHVTNFPPPETVRIHTPLLVPSAVHVDGREPGEAGGAVLLRPQAHVLEVGEDLHEHLGLVDR